MFKKIKDFFAKLFNSTNSISQVTNLVSLIKSHEDECTKSIEGLISGDIKFKDITPEQRQAMITNCTQSYVKTMGYIKDLSSLQADIKDKNYIGLVQDIISKYGK